MMAQTESKAGEYYAEAKDVFCAVLKSANNAYLVADSYYKAYQDVRIAQN